MTRFEAMEAYAEDLGIEVIKADLPDRIHGLYYARDQESTITINAKLQLTKQKRAVLAEELGHHFTSGQDSFDAANKNQVGKIEWLAFKWAVEYTVPKQELYKAMGQGLKTNYELAEYFDVTEAFMERVMAYYAGEV